MHAHIRAVLAAKYDDALAQSVSVLYGGSVKPANAKEIFAPTDVDGGLSGGASLKAEACAAIVNAFSICKPTALIISLFIQQINKLFFLLGSRAVHLRGLSLSTQVSAPLFLCTMRLRCPNQPG